MNDNSVYHDCKINFFDNPDQAIQWFVDKYHEPPKKIITTSQGWLVGPVPGDNSLIQQPFYAEPS